MSKGSRRFYPPIGQVGNHAELVGWLGIGIAIIGLILRYWAAKTLGKFYTRTLRVVEGQSVVDKGAYRVIRHPGYLGVFLSSVGTGLVTMNWPVVAIILVLGLVVYPYRIRVEEEMLQSTFGEEYKAYRQRTWSFLPFIY